MPAARLRSLRVIDAGVMMIAAYRGLATLPGVQTRFFVPEIIEHLDRVTPGPAWPSALAAGLWFTGALGIALHLVAGGRSWSPRWLTGYPVSSLILVCVMTLFWATSYGVQAALGQGTLPTSLMFLGLATVIGGHTMIEMQDGALSRALGEREVRDE